MLTRRQFFIACGIAGATALSSRTGLADTQRVTFDWPVPHWLPARGTVRRAFVIVPATPLPSRRVVLYFPALWANHEIWHVPEMNDPNALAMADAGLYVAGLDQGETFGAHGDELPFFLETIAERFGASLKVSGWVRSRGGCWARIVAQYPDGFFDRIGGQAPITDGFTYDPIGMARVFTGIQDKTAALVAYTRGSPSVRDGVALNGLVDAFIRTKVPMMIGYGTADTTVRPDRNILTFQRLYEAAGGKNLTLIPMPGADHVKATMTMLPDLIDFMAREAPR